MYRAKLDFIKETHHSIINSPFLSLVFFKYLLCADFLLLTVRKNFHLQNMGSISGKIVCLSALPQFRKISFLESNSDTNPSSVSFIAGVGDTETQKSNDFRFGHFSYDYKNNIENLSSENLDGIKFQDTYFFTPRYVFKMADGFLDVVYDDKIDTEESVRKLVNEIFREGAVEHTKLLPAIKIQSRFTKQEYIDTIKQVKDHIHRGDIYEMNFCMEFFAENAEINPSEVFQKLNGISGAPFSCFYKIDSNYLMCASPERFIKKTGNKLLSQPIKGTARRGKTYEEDEQIKQKLLLDKKEQSENVMIVDLVRNDLSRIAKEGTVGVEELFGIYTFRQVHQMISTVSCELGANISFEEIIRATFPMGSMTGAPKIRAMELIEKYERSKRGLFSGSVGYITPDGDFDFNVVIRSILYNSTNKYLSFQVGSAITANSNPEQEYEECMLKAKAMFEVLGN